MALDRTRMNNKVRTSFEYGWVELCISNHLNVDDTCFFSMIREATCNNDEDEEWEEEQEDDEAKLKVEVRKMNGGWLRWTRRKSWHDLYFIVSSKLLSDLSRFPSIGLS